MKEVLWHGRGGQGVVVASSILGTAVALYDGKYALSIPSFGGQRRDAPLIAITRVDEIPIRRRDLTSDPDYIIILDDSLTSSALAGRGHGKQRHIIVNSRRSASDLNLTDWELVTIVDAEAIASKILGRPVTNTVMVGVLAAVTNIVRLNSVKKATTDVVAPEITEKNVAAVEAGFRSAGSSNDNRSTRGKT